MLTREAIAALFVRGGVLADEMGLGKTWISIALFLNEVVADTLLLVPSMLQPQWSEALGKSGIPHRVLCAPTKKGEASRWREVAGLVTRPFRVTLATYDRAVHNIDLLKTAPFDRIVCDEGHVLRNGYDTKRFRTLLEIVAPRRWILSGTPVQNNKNDFQNLLKFLQMDGEIRLRTPASTIAAEVVLRRTVGEVREAVPTMPTEKPLHAVHPVVFPPGSEEEKVFNSLVGRFEHAVEVGAKMALVLELYLRIRQFISHPLIYVEAMKRKFKRAYRMGQTERVEVHHMLLADDAEKNLDRYMARLHGMKREVALEIHPGLFCDSAVSVEEVLEELDAAMPEAAMGVAEA